MTPATILRGLCALLALLSVAPLLAWVYGVGSFASWYWRVTFPALVVLALLAWGVSRRSTMAQLHSAMLAGVAGGLLGTIAYDLVRVPFTLAGQRLLAPIDSYGVLLLDATGSNARTGFAGWAFHTTCGVCFAIAYAVVASGRSRWWAVGWAMVLESVAVLSPFAQYYGLSGNWGLIAIAYAAHVPYGLAIGLCCEDVDRTVAAVHDVSRRAPAVVLLGATAVGLLLWQQPWSTTASVRLGETVAPGPSAVIVNERFSPQWVRIPPGGCAAIRNDDDVARTVGGVQLQPGDSGRLCLNGAGVHRVKLSGPYTGGFVIVDPELPRSHGQARNASSAA